jgi:hypothetical protein
LWNVSTWKRGISREEKNLDILTSPTEIYELVCPVRLLPAVSGSEILSLDHD